MSSETTENSREKDPNEIVLTETQFLVSRTDLEGNITYINSDFTIVTGYTEDELIGRNHNIIRHPDTPRAVFKSLWKSIKQSKKWTGYIKNKAKDGKFYWVDAEVTPFLKDGAHVGYKSVRKAVPPLVIKQLGEKYAKMSEDESDEPASWSVERELFDEFDELSKKANMGKEELFKKMLMLGKQKFIKEEDEDAS